MRRTVSKIGNIRDFQESIRARNIGMFNLSDVGVAIVGCGAIGSFTASTLARSGVARFRLYDPDDVAPENIGVQDFHINQLGVPKVYAVSDTLSSINPLISTTTSITKVDNEYRIGWYSAGSNNPLKTCLIMAVDSMRSRRSIANAVNNTTIERGIRDFDCVIDARMGSETFQMYTFSPFKLEEYMETWYSDEEGDSEACAGRSTAYCGSMAGSFITNEVKKQFTDDNIKTREMVFSFPSLLLESKIHKPKIKSMD